ncbi:MAG: F0F1 ATP synthase subunit delta [Lachnospiraceae bacterium]
MSTHEKYVLKVAPPYDDDLVRRIEDGFSGLLGFKVQFEVTEDPALLCGFVAYVRGVVYDVSGKTQLGDIQEHLMDSMIVPPAVIKEEDDDS